MPPPAFAADVEAWYYYDDDDATERRGPFTLNRLKWWLWCDEVHSGFSHATEVHSGSCESVTLGTALYNAGLLDDSEKWFYNGHGPYTLAQLREWVAESHFDSTEFVSVGPSGGPVALAEVLN